MFSFFAALVAIGFYALLTQLVILPGIIVLVATKSDNMFLIGIALMLAGLIALIFPAIEVYQIIFKLLGKI